MVNDNPGRPEPGPRSFRVPRPTPNRGVASEDALPTERLMNARQVLAQRPLDQPAADPRHREQQARPQRTRRTVDLPASTHRALDVWQREAADRLGVARVTGQEVISALIDQLLIDPKLGEQITRAIEARR